MPSAYDYFISQGWSASQSAGIVGNLLGESNLDPYAIGDGGLAFGIAQWHPDRQANFKSVFGVPIQKSNLQQQLQFVNWELNNTESSAGNLLRKATNVVDATKTFMQKFERPANMSSFGNRLDGAKKVLESGGGGGVLSSIADGLGSVIGGLPVIGGVAGALGIGGKSWIDQIRDWLAESNFWQRLAIGFLAIILIIGAIYLLGSGSIKKTIQQVAK